MSARHHEGTNETSAYMVFFLHNHYQSVYLYFSVFQLVSTNCFSILNNITLCAEPNFFILLSFCVEFTFSVCRTPLPIAIGERVQRLEHLALVNSQIGIGKRLLVNKTALGPLQKVDGAQRRQVRPRHVRAAHLDVPEGLEVVVLGDALVGRPRYLDQVALEAIAVLHSLQALGGGFSVHELDVGTAARRNYLQGNVFNFGFFFILHLPCNFNLIFF